MRTPLKSTIGSEKIFIFAQSAANFKSENWAEN